MTDPASISLPADTYVLVATGVSVCRIKKMSSKPNVYLESYRDTGNPAPTLRSEGLPIFQKQNYKTIDSPVLIDVYVMAVGVAGEIRVELE